MKITKVLKNNGASYAIVVRVPTIHASGNGWKNNILRVYYSEFHALHTRQVDISVKIFPRCSMKITKAVKNNGASFFDFQRIKVLNWKRLYTNSNKWKNYTLGVYYWEFHVLHIRQLYICIKNFPHCLMKITEVFNNNGVPYANVVRFPTIQNAQLVELTYKR